LQNLATLGRHYFLTVIVSCQYAKKLIGTSVRNNIDYLFFWDINMNMIKTMYEMMSIHLTEQEFKTYINNNNNDYQFIFYNSKEKEKIKRLITVKAKQLKLKFC